MSYMIQFDEFFRMTYKLRWQTPMQPTHFVPRKPDFGLSIVGFSGQIRENNNLADTST